VTIDTFGSGFDTVLAVHTGGAVNALTPLACNDNTLDRPRQSARQSRVAFTATAGTTYHVQVGGFMGDFGDLLVNFNPAPPPPPNDSFATAARVAVPSTVTADTTGARTEPGEPLAVPCGQGSAVLGATVWYALTPTTTGLVTIDTAGSNLDSVVAVYVGNAVDRLTPVACNDDSGPGTLASRITFTATAGTTYRLQVGGFAGDFGNLAVSVSNAAPAPAPHPHPAAGLAGAPAKTLLTRTAPDRNTLPAGQPTTDRAVGPAASSAKLPTPAIPKTAPASR
jgi:hypothetical protein